MKKEFKSFTTRPIRISDKVWEALKQKKALSGKTWDKFIELVIKELPR